jgi:hypothetical protein
MGYYNSDPDRAHLYQGDILKDYPTVILPDKAHYEVNEFTGTSTIQVKRFITNVLIISQTCDIGNRELVAICPVFPITRMLQTPDSVQLQGQQSNAQVEGLRKAKINYRFWLPEITGLLEESYADFVIINTVDKGILDIARRISSLSERYRSHLGEALHRYFCRPVTIT